MSSQNYNKVLKGLKNFFIKSVPAFACELCKRVKKITLRSVKNFVLNIISCVMIGAVLWVTLSFDGYVFPKNPDYFSAQKIVENIKNLELNMTSVIYVKNEDGKWEEYKRIHGDENRIWISLKKIPEDLQNAFIAIEDEDFKKHEGVDWERTILAGINQVFEYSSVEFGASTITQQLIKNITSDNSKDYKRKIREISRALYVEKQLSKDEILEAYLNTIALGNGINGVQVAANNYFNKEVAELSLAECAAIAAITKNPNKYNPVESMKENTKRRRVVLDKMLELGFISEKEYTKAYDEEIKLDFSQKESLDTEINDYFVDTLIEQLIDDLAEKNECDKNIASQMLYNGGYKIYATMDRNIQSIMEETYNNEKKYFYETHREKGEEIEKVQSAMTVMDYEGRIVGIVGGTGEKDVNRSLNRAYSVPRQPGSTMKPLGVYSQAIENDIVNYTSTVLDEPVENYYSKGKSGPREWFGDYMGEVPLNYALRRSMNAVPVRILEEVGIENSYKFLTKKLNFKHLVKADKNPSSLALGGCTYGITPTESAAAFAIFGNGGVYHKPTTYYKVVDINGKVVLEPEKGERVISSATSTIMNHMLREVVYKSGGTGTLVSSYNYRMKAYAKTGTSSDTKDSWLVGGTPYYVGSVWYGFDHNYRVYNTNSAKTIWRDVMRKIHEDLEPKQFEDSEDVYRKGDGYYKDGTSPGEILKEEDYLNKKEEEEETSSEQSTTSDAPTTSEPTNEPPIETPPGEGGEGTSSEPPVSSGDASTDQPTGDSSDTSSEETPPDVPTGGDPTPPPDTSHDSTRS